MWEIDSVRCQPGGKTTVPRQRAPFGLRLPYRRARGEGPAGPTPLLDSVAENGWRVEFIAKSSARYGSTASPVRLGDLLLEMAVAAALYEGLTQAGHAPPEMVYEGTRYGLMRRCRLPLNARPSETGHTVFTPGGNGSAPRIEVRPNRPPIWDGTAGDTPERIHVSLPTWLDPVGADVDVHAALPKRYYLRIEQDLGVRLPKDHSTAPSFRASTSAADARHVVFVTTTSTPSRKDYGIGGFLRVAAALLEQDSGDWRFTVLAPDGTGPLAHRLGHPVEVLTGVDAADCVDIFGASELVIGNDTGLTHLAALTERPDGSGPHVVGLYGRHSYLKWITDSPRHHAVATPYSQMTALADNDTYVNQYGEYIDDAVWGESSSMTDIPAKTVAAFAASCAGWSR